MLTYTRTSTLCHRHLVTGDQTSVHYIFPRTILGLNILIVPPPGHRIYALRILA